MISKVWPSSSRLLSSASCGGAQRAQHTAQRSVTPMRSGRYQGQHALPQKTALSKRTVSRWNEPGSCRAAPAQPLSAGPPRHQHGPSQPSLPLTSSPLAANGSNFVPASSGLALPLLPPAARPRSPPSPFMAATWHRGGRRGKHFSTFPADACHAHPASCCAWRILHHCPRLGQTLPLPEAQNAQAQPAAAAGTHRERGVLGRPVGGIARADGFRLRPTNGRVGWD